jgi:hypothetical protein
MVCLAVIESEYDHRLIHVQFDETPRRVLKQLVVDLVGQNAIEMTVMQLKPLRKSPIFLFSEVALGRKS